MWKVTAAAQIPLRTRLTRFRKRKSFRHCPVDKGTPTGEVIEAKLL